MLPYQTAGADPTGGTPTFLLTPWMTQGLKIHIHFPSAMRRCFHKWNLNESIHQLSLFFVEKERAIPKSLVKSSPGGQLPRTSSFDRHFQEFRKTECVCVCVSSLISYRVFLSMGGG